MNSRAAESHLLRDSVSWCKQKCKESGSSFYPAFRLLDLPRREAMYALYAFARITDDLGDSAEPVEQRRELLSQWRECAQAVLSGGSVCPSRDSQLGEYSRLWPALGWSVDRFGMPLVHFDELVQGVMLDLEHTQPVDWPATENYCYHVATTVGLLCTYIWRKDPEVPPDHKLSHHCGVAFQLTNILRDIAEDAAIGRIYLPAEELDRFGIDPQTWLSCEPSGKWQELVSSVVQRAHAGYDAGWGVVDQLSPRSRKMFSLMWHSYRQLLRNIEANKQRLWIADRIRLSRFQKLRMLSSVLRP